MYEGKEGELQSTNSLKWFRGRTALCTENFAAQTTKAGQAKRDAWLAKNYGKIRAFDWTVRPQVT
jgi:hypothetical protein